MKTSTEPGQSKEPGRFDDLLWHGWPWSTLLIIAMLVVDIPIMLIAGDQTPFWFYASVTFVVGGLVVWWRIQWMGDRRDPAEDEDQNW